MHVRNKLQVIELAGVSDDSHLAELLVLHAQAFPEHPHVLDELRENARIPREQEKCVLHQLLCLVDDVPAGFVVVHSNRDRRVGLIHFLAVAPEFQGREVGGTKVSTLLVEHAVELVASDLGASCSGVVAESEPALLPSWASWGFSPLPITYSEPFHGMHWRDHEPLEFFDMTLVGYNMSAHSLTELGRKGASAFLLDHYDLPPDHAVVQRATG